LDIFRHFPENQKSLFHPGEGCLKAEAFPEKAGLAAGKFDFKAVLQAHLEGTAREWNRSGGKADSSTAGSRARIMVMVKAGMVHLATFRPVRRCFMKNGCLGR